MGSLFLFLTLILVVPSTFADSIFVAPVTGTVSPADMKTIRELVQLSVQDQENHQTARSADNADFVLKTRLIQFDSYTLSMSKWKGQKKITSRQWKAQSRGELEGVVNTAVKELLGSKGQKKNRNSLKEQVEEKKQQQVPNRVQALKQVLLAFGPAYYSNLNSSDSAIALVVGYYWNVNDNVDLGLQTDFSISTHDSDANMWTAKVVANYFPIVGDISPYIGGGFGYGYAAAHKGSKFLSDDRASGFAGGLQVGIKFFRTSNVNLGLGLDYTRIFDKTSHGQPSELIVKVGLYY